MYSAMQACQFVPSFHYVSFIFFSLVESAKKKTAELLTIETKSREIIDFHFHSVVFVSMDAVSSLEHCAANVSSSIHKLGTSTMKLLYTLEGA
jgi:hypothetical protein